MAAARSGTTLGTTGATSVVVRAATAEVLRGDAGDGQTHKGVGQGQVEDEAPALAALPAYQLEQGSCHQKVGGDNEAGGHAEDPAHLSGIQDAACRLLDGIRTGTSHGLWVSS